MGQSTVNGHSFGMKTLGIWVIEIEHIHADNANLSATSDRKRHAA